MTYRVDVVETVPAHLPLIERAMRAGDRAEAVAMGLDPGQALRQSLNGSIFCHTAFVDDEPAAVFGLAGALVGDTGHPWLATTPAIEKIPKTFLRCARIEVGYMLDAKPLLVNWVDARYYRAQRLLEAIGFILFAPEPIGPQGQMFRRFEMARDGL